MPFKLREGAETEGLPTITLAGEKYFIPRLELRHRITVALLLPKMRDISARARATFGISEQATAEEVKQQIAAAVGKTFEFSEDDYNAYLDIISAGLRGLYPSATREALLGEPIDFEELYVAWPVIVQQGASRRPPAGEA